MKSFNADTDFKLEPQTRLVLLSGVPVRVVDVAERVGVFDEIRADVRRLSTVQPVEKVSLERVAHGYRGVLYSRGKPYLFAMDSQGFIARPALCTAEKISRLCAKLSDAETKLTAAWDVHVAIQQQENINRDFESGQVPIFTALFQGPNSGPTNDVIERVPGAYRQRKKPTSLKTTEAAGGVVVNDDGKVLLIKPANGYGGYEWTFPKGYLTQAELMFGVEREAAEREVEEETGYKVEGQRVITTIKHNDGGICTYYKMTLRSEKPGEHDDEVEETRWVTFMEAMELLNDDKDIELLGIAFKEVPSLVVKSEQHTGYMVALYLPHALAKRVALDGGESASDLHVTIVYLGKGLSDEDKKKATDVVRKLSEVTPPISGKLAGIGRFSSSTTTEGRDVVYLSVDSPSLSRFRPVLVDALNSAGIAVNEVHGYSPHVTLSYIATDAESPLKRFEPVDVTFTKLCAVSGSSKQAFPMRARMTLKKARNVKEPGKRGAQTWIDDKGNARYDDKPVKKQPQKNAAAGSGGVSAVPFGKKALRVFKNPMSVSFKRRTSNHEADAFDRPASRAETYRVQNVSEGEADFIFNELKNSKHKKFTDFLNAVVKPVWDDDDGKNPWSVDAARAYVGNIMLYLERDGAIENARDALYDRKVDYARLAKSVATMERSAPAQKFIRSTMRELLSHYGAVSRQTDERWANHIRVDGRLTGAAAYFAWNGRVAVRADYVPGIERFARAVSDETRLADRNDAARFEALIHEEFHGASNGQNTAYQGVGVVVEEVATEVAARFVMRDKYGHMEANESTIPLREWIEFQTTASGPYADYIGAVVTGLRDITGESEAWAAETLEKACLRTKQADAPKSEDPTSHVHNFVAAFGDTLTQPQKDKLISHINQIAVRKIALTKAINVKQPGLRGAKYWIDDKGVVRYDEKPMPKVPAPESVSKQPVEAPEEQVAQPDVVPPAKVDTDLTSEPEEPNTVVSVEPTPETKPETQHEASRRQSIDFTKLAHSFENLEDPESQKFARSVLRSLLSDYDIRSKMPDNTAADVLSIDTKLDYPGYHRWHDSGIVLAPMITENLHGFAKAIADGSNMVATYKSLKSFQLLVHEELHGAASAGPGSYRGVGIVLEEVTTEVTARKIVREKFGDVRAADLEKDDPRPWPAREWPSLAVNSTSAYGKYIGAVSNAIKEVSSTKFEQLGISDADKQQSWANNALERACVRMKQDGLKLADSPEAHLGNFLECLGDDVSATGKLALAEKLRAIPSR